MTNVEQVQEWHTQWVIAKSEAPGKPHRHDNIHWATADAIAAELDAAAAPEPESCPIAEAETDGAFYCSRQKGHEGPCAAHPKLL